MKSRIPVSECTSEYTNEYFLHNRRRGRGHRSRGILRRTPLSKEFDTSKNPLFGFLDTWFEAARFCADVQRVMGLRMMRLASGGPSATTEAWQMVSEKVSAFEEAQLAIVSAWATGSLATGNGLYAATDGAYAPYRRCVRANCVRLDSHRLR